MNKDIKKIKEYIELNKYEKASLYLEKIIIDYTVNLIKQEQEDFEYTTIFDLIDASNIYIKDKRKNIARQIRNYSEYLDEMDNVYRLIELCIEYNIMSNKNLYDNM